MTLPYPARYVVGAAEVDRWCARLFDLGEELRAGMLTASSPDALARVDAARDACEWITGDLDDIARRAGLAGMLPDVPIEPSDAAEAARVLRAVVDGVSAAPDTTADPLHLAYLAGYADALDHVAGDADPGRPTTNESGHDSRDTSEHPSAQDT